MPNADHEAFIAYSADVRRKRAFVAHILIAILMPLGTFLDYFIYPEKLVYFLKLRLLCSLGSVIAARFCAAPRDTRFRFLVNGEWAYLGPAFFISWMIAVTDGAASSYYAGIILVMVAISTVMHSSFKASVVAGSTMLGMYFGGCLFHGIPSQHWGILFNNLYFLILTSVISITGNYFYNKLWKQEFESRHELDQSRQKLEETNKELRRMDEMKMNFFSNISHELRTPLTLLVSPLEKLRDKKKPPSEEAAQEHLELMYTNTMRLLNLINNLLDLVKLDFSSMDLKLASVDLGPFIAGLLCSMRGAADDKGLTLKGSVDPSVGEVQADRDKLEKIVVNLVFNAIKFTAGGGSIEVRAWRDGERLRMDVQDTGIGIPPDALDSVFGRFWQVDSSAKRKHQGTGIGLSLVKSLVELHGGGVTVESTLGVGTTFHLWMPYRRREDLVIEKTPAKSPEESAKEREDQRLDQLALGYPALTALRKTRRPDEFPLNPDKYTVLAVDDEPDLLRFLKIHFEPDYNFIGAVDGYQGIEKAKQFLPDVILLDMMMPGKSGVEVCEELRKYKPTELIPIVMVTASNTEETRKQLFNAGANDFASKPFCSEELFTRVHNLIRNSEIQREIKAKNRELEQALGTLAETQSHLIQSEKMSSLGIMTAGLIHEINNPMNIATMGLDVLRKNCEGGIPQTPEALQRHLTILGHVEESIRRTAALVSDLRTFSHPSSDFSPVSLTKVVESSRRFVSNQLESAKKPVGYTAKVPDDLTVWGNYGQLVQVVTNFLQNAIDILKEKEFSEPDAPQIEVAAEREADHVRLSVRDNGKGIPEAIREKLFSPFFTTKDVGKGMGLGLSICYRIIQAHHGAVEVKSEPEQFTKFIVTLPTAPAQEKK